MNQIRRILLFGCFFPTIFNIKAYDFEHEKIYYKITSESEATVGVDRGTTEYIGKIVIPEEVQGGDGIFVVGPGGEIIGPPVVDYSKTYRVTSIEVSFQLINVLSKIVCFWCKSIVWDRFHLFVILVALIM